ncbi:MAG: global cell cycle regulator GcrA-like protein [Alphaproteobacteria bacterium]|nr:global cell cycle regulator GcrA-like protein [Alphaproteobacteria bacterium]
MGWTDESVEQLRQMWAKGLTANEIAKKLGVTKNAIVGKVHRLCLKARPSPIKNKTGDSPEKNDEAFDVEINDMPEIADEALEVFHEEKKPLSGTNVRLIDLDSHTCRWPIGDPRDEDFCFCGKKVRAGQTYCDEHSAMAYVKANRK